MRLKSDIIELIYDVPLGKSEWNNVLDKIRHEMSAMIAFMLTIRPNQEPSFIVTTPKQESIWKIYGDYYHQIDPWNDILESGKFQTDFIHYGRAFIPEKSFKKTEYYNDFWKIMRLGEYWRKNLYSNRYHYPNWNSKTYQNTKL